MGRAKTPPLQLTEGHLHALPDECCDNLNHVIHNATQALRFCKKCSDAGLDMTQFTDQLERQKSLAEGLKSQFFPNRS